MPLLLHKEIKDQGEIGLWKITETPEFFLSHLLLSAEEKAHLEALPPRKQMEWLSSRYLLHFMSGRKERGRCIIDKYGKPYLENSAFDISISHSHGIVAVFAGPGEVGVDVQKIVAKIERIAQKFMRPEELACLSEEKRMEHLHIFWGAKESLYKAYGKKELSFKNNIKVEPFDYVAFGQNKGYVQYKGYRKSFDIQFQQYEDNVLVYCIEQEKQALNIESKFQ